MKKLVAALIFLVAPVALQAQGMCPNVTYLRSETGSPITAAQYDANAANVRDMCQNAQVVAVKWDFGTGTLALPYGTTLPATCVAPNEIFIDSDATTGERLYVCETTNTWVLQGDGGGGGGGDSFVTIDTSSGTDPVADSATDTLQLIAGTGITVTGDSTADSVTIASTVTDTNASTLCAGTTTYLDGEGNCDDISSVYSASAHTHTTTTVSGLDISDDTNLAVSAPVVLTGDTLSLNQNAGTDVTADLEEESHASEHAENAADEILAENLGTACAAGEPLEGDGTGGWVCGTDAGTGSFTSIDVDYGNETITSDMDIGGGTLQVPNSNTLPGTCEVGDIYMDTDATTGQRLYLCESSNTLVQQGGGGGAYVRVAKTGNQSLTDLSLTALTWDTETEDASGFHDNSTDNARLTVPSGMDGVYQITCGVLFASNGTGFRRAEIRFNGGSIIGGSRHMAVTTGSTATVVTATTIYRLAAGQYVDCLAQQSSGGSLNVETSVSTHFEMAKLP
jgi:hypothetical protein